MCPRDPSIGSKLRCSMRGVRGRLVIRRLPCIAFKQFLGKKGEFIMVLPIKRSFWVIFPSLSLLTLVGEVLYNERRFSVSAAIPGKGFRYQYLESLGFFDVGRISMDPS